MDNNFWGPMKGTSKLSSKTLWVQIVYSFPEILIKIEIYIFMGQILGQGSERFPWKWTDRLRSIVYK